LRVIAAEQPASASAMMNSVNRGQNERGDAGRQTIIGCPSGAQPAGLRLVDGAGFIVLMAYTFLDSRRGDLVAMRTRLRAAERRRIDADQGLAAIYCAPPSDAARPPVM
jgi:hypothetical protein